MILGWDRVSVHGVSKRFGVIVDLCVSITLYLVSIGFFRLTRSSLRLDLLP